MSTWITIYSQLVCYSFYSMSSCILVDVCHGTSLTEHHTSKNIRFNLTSIHLTRSSGSAPSRFWNHTFSWRLCQFGSFILYVRRSECLMKFHSHHGPRSLSRWLSFSSWKMHGTTGFTEVFITVLFTELSTSNTTDMLRHSDWRQNMHTQSKSCF